MKKWWQSGFDYAKTKDEEKMSEFRPDVLTDKEMDDAKEDAKNMGV